MHNNQHDSLDHNDYPYIPDEWLDEEEAYWSEQELDPADSNEYDPVDEGDNSEAADHLDRYDEDFDWDDTPIGLEYDGYNDPDNY